MFSAEARNRCITEITSERKKRIDLNTRKTTTILYDYKPQNKFNVALKYII